MKGELKAGGLALVIKSKSPEEIGKCVTLVQLIRPGDLFTSPDGTVCRWNENRPIAWVVSGDVHANAEDEPQKYYGWALYQPYCLLPIDGDDHQERDQLAKDKPAELTA